MDQMMRRNVRKREYQTVRVCVWCAWKMCNHATTVHDIVQRFTVHVSWVSSNYITTIMLYFVANTPTRRCIAAYSHLFTFFCFLFFQTRNNPPAQIYSFTFEHNKHKQQSKQQIKKQQRIEKRHRNSIASNNCPYPILSYPISQLQHLSNSTNTHNPAANRTTRARLSHTHTPFF